MKPAAATHLVCLFVYQIQAYSESVAWMTRRIVHYLDRTARHDQSRIGVSTLRYNRIAPCQCLNLVITQSDFRSTQTIWFPSSQSEVSFLHMQKRISNENGFPLLMEKMAKKIQPRYDNKSTAYHIVLLVYFNFLSRVDRQMRMAKTTKNELSIKPIHCTNLAAQRSHSFITCFATQTIHLAS